MAWRYRSLARARRRVIDTARGALGVPRPTLLA